MRQRVTRSVVMGLCLGLGWLSGCRGEAASSGATEAAAEAKGDAVAALDPAIARNLPPGATAEDAERGRDLFLVCATCHGLDAGGTQLGPSLRDGEWTRGSGTVEDIERVVREGIAEPTEYPVPMPPGGGAVFEPEELRSLVAYVYAVSRSGPTTPR